MGTIRRMFVVGTVMLGIAAATASMADQTTVNRFSADGETSPVAITGDTPWE